MSQKEFQRVKVIENAAGGRLSVREAARLLQLSERQVQRLKRRYQPDSIAWSGEDLVGGVVLKADERELGAAAFEPVMSTSNSKPKITLGYLFSLRTMILTHGIPLSLYRDRHAIFQRNDAHWTLAEQLAGKQTPTQLGRALEELGIQQIPAYSPQAKGRIERAWRTFQDRLVSELRLAHATTLPQANAVLARFCADYNQRFARAAADAACDFRSLPRRFDLARCLSLRYQRVVAADHTVTFRRTLHRPAAPARPSRLRRRDRRTLASARRHAAHLSRRLSLVGTGSAAPRARRSTAGSTHHAAETENPNAAHLQSLRPPRFSGRYLNATG